MIGYIVCPILCLLPGIILDLITKVWPDLQVPTGLNGTFDGLNGLIGLFDSLLMLSDPALLAVWEDLEITAATSDSWFGKLTLGMKAVFSGDVIEKGLEAKRVEDGKRDSKDILASNFGLGTRTRMDGVETRGEMDDLEHKTPDPRLSGEMAQPWASRRRAHSPRVRNDVEEIPRKSSEEDVWRTGDRDARGIEIAGDESVEVRVTVDVTRISRLSRVELVEDWLTGL
jgi:hypothetical protein